MAKIYFSPSKILVKVLAGIHTTRTYSCNRTSSKKFTTYARRRTIADDGIDAGPTLQEQFPQIMIVTKESDISSKQQWTEWWSTAARHISDMTDDLNDPKRGKEAQVPCAIKLIWH